MKAGVRPRQIRDSEGSCERRPGGSLRESREAKEVREALSNWYGECANFISPIQTRSKRHLAPHIVTDSHPRVDPDPQKTRQDEAAKTIHYYHPLSTI